MMVEKTYALVPPIVIPYIMTSTLAKANFGEVEFMTLRAVSTANRLGRWRWMFRSRGSGTSVHMCGTGKAK